MLVAQPRSHGAAGERCGRRCECARVGGVDGLGEGVEKGRLLAEEVGLPGEQGGDVALRHVV